MPMSCYCVKADDDMDVINTDAAALTVEVISDLSRLEALEEQWHALARNIPWPMAQFDWIMSAAQSFVGDRLCIITVREEGILRAVAPLVLQRYGFTHRLECIGYKLFEPQLLVAQDSQYRKFLFVALQRLRRPLILRGVPATCQEVECFRTVSGYGLRLVTDGGKDSFVPFDDQGRNLEKRMSASRHKTLKRKRRAAEKHGPVHFRILRPRPEEVPKLLDELFRVESSGWKGKAATGLQCDLEQAAFFRMYCERVARAGVLRLGFMTIGEAAAAVRLDVVWGNKSWEFKIGYDERFANCSPGLLLSHEALKHGQAEGLLGHHFLGAAEPWHETWTAATMDRVTLRYYPKTMGGGIALLQDTGLRLMRSLIGQSSCL